MSDNRKPWDGVKQPVPSGSRIVLPNQRQTVVKFNRLAVRDNSAADGGRTLYGHAAVFDQLSEVLCGWIGGADSFQFGYFREKIARGAFQPVLSDDVRMTINHDPNLVMGRTTSRTLRIAEDNRGLAFECDLAPEGMVDYVDALCFSITRGDISQCSFMFKEPVAEESWDFSNEDGDGADEDNPAIRTVLKHSGLFDTATVTYPAYPQTDALLREAMTTGASARTVTRSLPSRAVESDVDETEREEENTETVEAPDVSAESTEETSDLSPDGAAESPEAEESEASQPSDEPQSDTSESGDAPDDDRSSDGTAEGDRLGAHAARKAKDLRLARAKRARAAADEK